MAITTRPANWEKLGKNGIPLDFEQFLKFYNRQVAAGLHPYMPLGQLDREDIADLWVANKDNLDVIVAEASGQNSIVGISVAYLVDPGKKIYERVICRDLSFEGKGVGTALAKESTQRIRELEGAISSATSIHNEPMIRVMKNLGYGDGVFSKDHYEGRINAPTQHAYQWIIQ